MNCAREWGLDMFSATLPVLFLQVDVCVEIPQLGVVRSLNVHVSGALAVWEYTRQHHLGRSPSLAPPPLFGPKGDEDGSPRLDL